MNFKRADGEFDWGGFAAMCGLGMATLAAYTQMVVSPIKEDIIENRTDIKSNAAVARRVEITVNRVDVLMTKQNETLGNLANTIDKLADRIDTRTRNGS